MQEIHEIKAAIEAYAAAYERLDTLQRESQCIPVGDQKTGAVGEFYAYLYLLSRIPQDRIGFAGHSNKGWDIEIIEPTAGARKVSVKTISDYSIYRAMSPIHDGFDDLFVILLDKSFEPRGFWTVTRAQLKASSWPLRGCRCPDPDPNRPLSGSRIIPFGKNRVRELKDAVGVLESLPRS
jgi:hypothetical protein